MSRKLLLASCALITVNAFACAPAERATTSSGTTLRLHYFDNEMVFSPAHWVPFRKLVFVTLLRRGPDGPEGWLVDEWSPSEDSRTWTYHIRENAFWHDGVPVTTDDIAFSLKLLHNPPVRRPLRRTYELEVLDEKTFRIRYEDKQTKNRFEYDVLCFPKHQLEVLDRGGFWYWDFWKQPVGNGPFRYVHHLPETFMKLAADPDYFLPGPDVDSVLIRFGGDPMLELRAGNVDIHVWANARVTSTLEPRLDYTLYGNSATTLFWNHQNPLFREVQARRALTMAIDRASLLALHGFEELPVLDAPIEFFRSTPPSEPIPFDPEEATRLVRGLGWADTNGDGVLERDGAEFRFELLVSNEEEAGQAVLVQAWLQDIGVAVDILTFPKGEIEERVKAGEFDAAIEGENWMFFTMGEAFEFLDPSRPSLIGYDHAGLYAAMVAWLNDFSDDATARRDQRLWEIFQRDVPVTVLEPTATAVVFNRRVRGIKPWLGFEFLDRARIEEE